MEAGAGSAGDRNEQHGQHREPEFAVTQRGGESRILNFEAAKSNADESHDDRNVQEVAAQVTAWLQEHHTGTTAAIRQ